MMIKSFSYHLIFGLILAQSSISYATHEIKPYFSAPYTGKKVQEYQVTLPLSRHEKASFNIPEDCGKLNSRLLEGNGHWGTRIERRLWIKTDDDCRYLNFLQKYAAHAEQDFVSNYDFYNAKIADLPLRPGCDLDLLLRNPAACPPSMPGMPNFSMFMDNMSMHQQNPRDLGDCRFDNGVFRGYIYHTSTGLRCIKDHKAPGYRILSVDFADVNGDKCQDAVLRMIPIGPGARPSLLVLPLSRCDKDGPFSLPPGSDYPRFGPSRE